MKNFLVLASAGMMIFLLTGCQLSQPVDPQKENSTGGPQYLVKNTIEGGKILEGHTVHKGEILSFISADTGASIPMNEQALGTLSSNSEDISSFFAPIHPVNNHLVFISTTKYNNEEQQMMSRIYSYNTASGELNLIHERKDSQRQLRTMGIDGSKLILMNDLIDNSPHPCFSAWASWDGFVALELADIETGLKPYAVPEYKKEEGRKKQETCMSQLTPEEAGTSTYTTPDESFSFRYPENWTVNENDNMAAVSFESPTKDGGKLQIVFEAGDSDFGLGSRTFDEKKLTNPNDIELNLTYFEADPVFYEEVLEGEEPDMNKITVHIGTELLPRGRMTFYYDKSVNPDAEDAMMVVLNSLKKHE